MFRDARILFRLITGPVFAGMCCVLTLSVVWELVKHPFVAPPRTVKPTSVLPTILAFVALAALTALLLWYFRHMLRKARAAEDGDYHDMTRRTWIAILWCSFVVGIICGGVMFINMIDPKFMR
jgi:hypothetical protein